MDSLKSLCHSLTIQDLDIKLQIYKQIKNNIKHYNFFNVIKNSINKLPLTLAIVRMPLIIELNLDRIRIFNDKIFYFLINKPLKLLSILETTISEVIFNKFNLLTNNVKLIFVSVLKPEIPYVLNHLLIDKLIITNIQVSQLELLCLAGMQEKYNENQKLRINQKNLISQKKIQLSLVYFSKIKAWLLDKKSRKIQPINIYFHEDLISNIKIWDTVMVVGILKTLASSNNFIVSNTNIYYEYIIIGLGYKKFNYLFDIKLESKKQLNIFSKFFSLASTPYLYYIIINHIIPNIGGIINIKKCILCMILSSSSKNRLIQNSNVNALFYSDNLGFKKHIFKILSYYNQEMIEFNSSYHIHDYKLSTIDKKSTLRQNYSNKFFLLYSNAFVLIDRFENMDFNTKALLEEIMTYGKISINYNTKIYFFSCTPRIFSWYNIKANKFNKFDLVKNMMENFYLNNKFDLLFKNYIHNSRLSNLFSTITDKYSFSLQTFSFPKILLRKYLLFTRSYVEPIITKDKLNYLIYYYLNLRLLNKKIKNLLPSIHFLISIIKISICVAKINCNLTVSFSHLKEAIKITNSSLLYNKYYFFIEKKQNYNKIITTNINN
mmetsp:Transcript_20448/g.32938  ORF Transcript_20448/g.32938 Transcript_20448/m.32938 type:complete len:605 (-) Transcript_20448:2706-4520(-)